MPQYTIGPPPPQAAPPPAAPPPSPYTIGPPQAAPGPPATPAPPPTELGALTANPNGQRTYKMHKPGQMTDVITGGNGFDIPYDQVQQAAQKGYMFTDHDNLALYARDHAADPVTEDQIDRYVASRPWYDPISLASLPARFLRGEATGLARGAAKTFTAFDRPPTSKLEQNLQLFAATPDNKAGEGTGEAAENTLELLSGEELLNLIGGGAAGVAKGLGIAEKLKESAAVAQLVTKHPMIAKLLKIGISSVKQGSLAGAQTLVKTGGDTDAALNAGGITAGLTAAIPGAGAVYQAGKTMVRGPAEAEAAAAAAAQKAEAAAQAERTQAHMQELAEQAAREQTAAATVAAQKAGQTADSASYSQVARDVAGPHLEAIETPNAPEVLSKVHDFTGAADRMTEANNAAYDSIDKLTGGNFRTLNKEVAQAQKAAWKGGNEEKGAYIEKLNEMEEMLNEYMGSAGMEKLPAVKASWRASYVLRDLGNLWDKNLSGLPGGTSVENAERGINGQGLHKDLVRAIKDHGRKSLESVLGPGGLDTLEGIAQHNMTAKDRAAFSGGVSSIAEELKKLEQQAQAEQAAQKAAEAAWPKPTPKPPPKMPQRLEVWGKRGAAMTAGGTAAHLTNMPVYYGMIAGETAWEAGRYVVNSIKTNPKIAKNFLFALDSGALPEHYAPLIAKMIATAAQKSQTDASQENRLQTLEQKKQEMTQ